MELDGVIPIPAKLRHRIPPTSDLLAAYVAAADTPGAALSRALMAGEDLLHPGAARFPAITLFLFVSDLATDGSPTGVLLGPRVPVLARTVKAAAVVRRVPTPPVLSAALGTICSGSASFVDRSIQALFDAIKLGTPDNLPGKVLVSVWNWLVDQGAPSSTSSSRR